MKIQVIWFCRHTGFAERAESCGHSRNRGAGAICVHPAIESRELDAPRLIGKDMVWDTPKWCPLDDALGRMLDWPE
jgi:hypothetical protein